MGSLLPLVAAVLLVIPLPAQEGLPKSTQELAATVARVAVLTPNDFETLQSQAQSGDREAEYLLALVYEDGRIVARDFAVSRNWMLKSAEQGYVPAQAGMGETYCLQCGRSVSLTLASILNRASAPSARAPGAQPDFDANQTSSWLRSRTPSILLGRVRHVTTLTN